MTFANHCMRFLKVAAVSVGLIFVGASASMAQEVTPEHTKAAKAAMVATGATSRLDSILPEVASFTKAGLIANRPDIESEISLIVDEVAISLAARRGPLEDEVAGVYSEFFTQAELIELEAFFTSDAGTKFLRLTPALFQQVDEAAKVWRNGITRDMAEQVSAKLKEQGLQ